MQKYQAWSFLTTAWPCLQVIQACHFPETLAQPVPAGARPCSSPISLFVVLLNKLGVVHAKFHTAMFVTFRPKSPWIACYVIFMPFLRA